MKLRSTITAIAFILGANALAVAQTKPSPVGIPDATGTASGCAEGHSGTRPKREIIRSLDPLVDDALRLLESQMGREFADSEILCLTKTPAYIRTYQKLFRDFCADPRNSNNMACEPAADSLQR